MKSSVESISGKSLAIKYGLIWTVINIAVFLFVYYVVPQFMGTWKHSVIQFIVGIGLAIYFTLEIRKRIGGYWSFSEALKTIFILFIIPTILLYFFSIAFGKWIEPSYPATITEISLNMTTELYENFTDDQEVIDQAILETEEALKKQFDPTFMDMVKSVLFSVLIYFVGSMIWAAIFKKERPVFYSPEEGVEGNIHD